MVVAAALLDSQVSGHLRSLSSSASMEPDGDRPLMGIGDTLRAMACWGRPDLLQHEKCMEWMLETCQEKTSGQGTCEELQQYLEQECEKEGEDQQLACDYKQELQNRAEEQRRSADDDKRGKKQGFRPADFDTAEGGSPSPAAAGSPSPAPPTRPVIPQPEVVHDKRVTDAGLPDQGIEEHSSEMVEHHNAETATSDWGNEWPQTRETEGESKEKICEQQPRLDWCKMYLSDREHREEERQERQSLWHRIFGL